MLELHVSSASSPPPSHHASHSPSSTASAGLKVSTGTSKKGRAFRASTLFPQATFVHQLGLDKLNEPEKLIDTSTKSNSNNTQQNPQMVALDYTQLDKIKEPANSKGNNTPPAITAAPPSRSPEPETTNVLNTNGKRYRGNSAETQHNNAKQAPRSNTLSSPSSSSTENVNSKPTPVVSSQATVLSKSPAKPPVPPINIKGKWFSTLIDTFFSPLLSNDFNRVSYQ